MSYFLLFSARLEMDIDVKCENAITDEEYVIHKKKWMRCRLIYGEMNRMHRQMQMDYVMMEVKWRGIKDGWNVQQGMKMAEELGIDLDLGKKKKTVMKPYPADEFRSAEEKE